MEYSELAYYKFFYDMGFYDEKIIYTAVKNAILTRQEYKIIVGKAFIDLDL